MSTPALHVPKLLDLPAAAACREELAAGGKQVVLVNGCFDLLHAGHIHFLEQARGLGDALFVALNSDESVRALKGPHRPVQAETERAYALGALASTTVLVLFRQPRLTAEIRALHPDIYAKAGDYRLETLDAGERAALQDVGADIRFVPFLPGFSSTTLIRRIAAAGLAGPAPA
ncbi:MAG: adenylyltransferase/cytidyltransferase family protein [Verrucomicrobiota bacterium]